MYDKLSEQRQKCKHIKMTTKLVITTTSFYELKIEKGGSKN